MTIKYIITSAVLALAFTALKAQNTLQKVRVTLQNGQKMELAVKAATWKPTLPCRFEDTANNQEYEFTGTDLQKVELIQPSATIDGCSQWTVCDIATPSIILGRKHTEKRLVGVVASNSKGTIYKWTVKQQIGTDKAETHIGLWYGIQLNEEESVYPFIQDSKVWFRDIKMIMGDNHPDFVKAVNNYYIKGKKSVVDERQAQLKAKPALLLEL